jgi:hypothetical protein
MAYQNHPSSQTSDLEAHEITPTPTASTNPPATSFTAKYAVQKVKNDLIFRSKWAEINGAMGDLGTYIPIVLALTLAKDLNLGTTLIFNGMFYVSFFLPKIVESQLIFNGMSYGCS